MSPLKEAVIIDDGTGRCKTGLAGAKAPKAVFPSRIGKSQGSGKTGEYIGDAAVSRRGVLTIENPLKLSVINDWEAIEKIWDHCFHSELRVDPKDRPVMLTDTPQEPSTNRKQMAQIMFESFSVPAFYVATKAVLTMYGHGRSTGLVIDSGYSATFTIPIVQGYVASRAVIKQDFGGVDLTNYLAKLLTKTYSSIKDLSDLETVRDIKESLCYVADDYDKEMDKSGNNQSLEKEYKLPDGQVINLASERFKCAEALFNPDPLGIKGLGLQYSAFQSIMKSQVDTRTDLYQNIVLTGGSTMMNGVEKRLKREITELAPAAVNPSILATSDREFSAWIGGSSLASLSSFQQMCVSKAEYEEVGPSIVLRKLPF